MDRRNFLGVAGAVAGSALLPACTQPLPQQTAPGRLLGTNLELGHRLRGGEMPVPDEVRRVPVLIVGGGIGGLSAGWKLSRAGFRDFLVAELEQEAGGNSRGLDSPAGPCPLGAHYLPLPGMQALAVRELLAELGVLQGDSRALRPHYDERYLCATPQERVYRNGLWQEGLWPQLGASERDNAQYARFHERMTAFRERRAFAVPMAQARPAADLLALDRVTMRDWLLAEGFDSPVLHWYVNYACRDDYGTAINEVSAWAGIHYYACRSGEAGNADSGTVLTAPDGNGWLARGLARNIGDRILPGALAFRVHDAGRWMEVDLWLSGEGRAVRLQAEQLIWAAPLFLVPRVFVGHERLKTAAASFTYAPWLVANLSVAVPPARGAGAPLAWDNVLYDSPGLGYVVSTHQQMRLHPQAMVLTYYRALSDIAPAAGREVLLARSREEWAEEVLADIGRAHPEIREITRQLDVVRLGHAMVRPVPGLIWGRARELFAGDAPRLRFAHADISGFSIFEEAQYRGVLAAERTLRRLGVRFTSSLV